MRDGSGTAAATERGRGLASFREALERRLCRELAGLVPESRVATIREAHSHLYGRDRVEEALAELQCATGPAEARRARRRARFLIDSYVARRCSGPADEMASWSMERTVRMGGEEVHFRDLIPAVRRSGDPHRRARLFSTHLACLREIRPALEECWASRYDGVRELGFEDYWSACTFGGEVAPARLRELAREGLACTREMYESGLDRHLEGSPAPGYADLLAMYGGADWDPCFGGDALSSRLRDLLSLLGDPDVVDAHVRQDLEPRPRKSSRPFCAGIRVPDEIVLVAKPAGGHRDYEGVWHEAGHALHLSHTAPSLPWEDGHLLDDATSEVWAFLVASLLRNPAYLDRAGIMPPDMADRYAAYAGFLEVCTFRRYCGKVLFEARLHQSGRLGRADDLYAETMGRALSVEVPGELGLWECDPGGYSADYLLAWIVEAAVRTRLERDHGRAWFLSSGALDDLRSCWARGQAEGAGGLLRRFGQAEWRARTFADAV